MSRSMPPCVDHGDTPCCDCCDHGYEDSECRCLNKPRRARPRRYNRSVTLCKRERTITRSHNTYTFLTRKEVLFQCDAMSLSEAEHLFRKATGRNSKDPTISIEINFNVYEG